MKINTYWLNPRISDNNKVSGDGLDLLIDYHMHKRSDIISNMCHRKSPVIFYFYEDLTCGFLV